MRNEVKSKQEIREESARQKEERKREKEARAKERKKEQARKWQEKQQRDRKRASDQRLQQSSERLHGDSKRPRARDSGSAPSGLPKAGHPGCNPVPLRRRGSGSAHQRTKAIEGDEVDGRVPDRSGNHFNRSSDFVGGGRKRKVGHQRTRDIKRAIREAKKRDGYRCRVCGSEQVDGAHLLPRRHPAPEYDSAGANWIMALCRLHHREYDSSAFVSSKYEWCLRHGLDREAKMLKILVDKGW